MYTDLAFEQRFRHLTGNLVPQSLLPLRKQNNEKKAQATYKVYMTNDRTVGIRGTKVIEVSCAL